MRIGAGSSFNNSNSLSVIEQQQKKIFEQLSSGLKVQKAQDDAAGLQLANRLTSQINGQNQAIRNANDSVSYAQVAEGALSSVSDAAFRIEELSIQAANGTLSPSDRKAIQQEITQLQGHVEDVYSNTRFGDKQVFGSSVEFQVGANSNQTIELGVSNQSLGDIDVTTQAGAQAAIGAAQSFREQVDSSRGSIGAFQNRVESSISNLTNQNINSQSSRSQIVDTDYAKAVSDQTANGIQSQVAIALQAQANFSDFQALNLLK
ncbi:flagellin [Psychrosphaera sp. B3R10]|uniref:Flagellin n=1 Tax=Psychrosphaera algicola TaxID=3023714 RepID=A0ABT5FAW6_9GAMM|nr:MULTISPECIES: flagellin [unclassified Psychrosphaera]MBU2884041.1 flagellin [Psychrosphaera sp. I2R16]MBU2988171.1 flagellin [Psychrosphaera sp. B3R10]MDC2888274.1 flagellin [Psychrosphaera sp. G1-22]MDO6718380.1 flagellin [Psychrosphaera sp. 1_MG-2023]